MMQSRHTHRKGSAAAWFFMFPSLLGVSVFVLVPFGDVIRRSCYEAMSGKFVGLANYTEVLQKESFLLAAKNTAKFIGIAIPLLLLASLLLSILLNEMAKAGGLFKSIFLVPMAVPAASVVLLWKAFFADGGLINAMLASVGAESSKFMQSSQAFYVLVFTYVWKNLGYSIVLWLAGLTGISGSLYEAAAIDGAGKLRQFIYVTLPGLLPTFFITAVLSLVNSFKVFREAYLVAGNYPHPSIYLLQHIFNNWFQELDIQKMSTAAVLLTAVILLVILGIHRLSPAGGDMEYL